MVTINEIECVRRFFPSMSLMIHTTSYFVCLETLVPFLYDTKRMIALCHQSVLKNGMATVNITQKLNNHTTLVD